MEENGGASARLRGRIGLPNPQRSGSSMSKEIKRVVPRNKSKLVRKFLLGENGFNILSKDDCQLSGEKMQKCHGNLMPLTRIVKKKKR